MATIMVICVLEVTRKLPVVYGNTCRNFCVYALVGRYMPVFFRTPGRNLEAFNDVYVCFY